METFKYLNILHSLNMVSITLSVSQELKQKMDEFEEINWSAVAREAIKRKILLLKQFKEFTKHSDFTEKEVLELGRKVSRSVRKRHQ